MHPASLVMRLPCTLRSPLRRSGPMQRRSQLQRLGRGPRARGRKLATRAELAVAVGHPNKGEHPPPPKGGL